MWLDEDEIAKLAAAAKMDRDVFESQFTRRVGKRVSLKEYPGGDCVFLEPKSRRCMVYMARPIQCRTWPFWDSNLATPEDWQATCRECPGAGVGQIVPLAEIQARAGEKPV